VNIVEGENMAARTSTQAIAKKRPHIIKKIGEVRAFVKEWILTVDLCSVAIMSTSIVILNSLVLDSKAYVEDLFENAAGLDASSLLARISDNLYS
jgi:hypothetical protein